MSQKRKRRSSVVEFGNGPTRVKIYTINRKDGYSEFTLVWKERGRRRTRSLSDMEEARMVAQQITVRLANGWEAGGEVTKRDLELLRYCEKQGYLHPDRKTAAEQTETFKEPETEIEIFTPMKSQAYW